MRVGLAFLLLSLLAAPSAQVRSATPQAIAAPVLKWQRGGCYSSWCETGWYSSPAVADLDADGAPEVIGSAYTIFVLDGATGAKEWHMRSGHDRGEPEADNVGRTWPGIVIADVDGDHYLEIVTAHSGGYVSVYNHNGYFESGWPKRPITNELRGLSVYDLDADGTMEIIVTAAVGSKTNTWVYEHNGTLRAGWPQLNNDLAYAWGVYNDNATVGDLDGDGMGEIVVPSDVHYICAYEANGAHIPANPIYGDKAWGRVGVHVDHWVDLRGYADCGTEHRPNFAHTPANMVDVNGDGAMEVVAMGNVYNCGTDPYTSLYEMPFVFNADRTRWNGDGFNWTAIPVPDGLAAPVREDYDVIESNMSNPVTADLDGDGKLEILFSSYDGRVHAYWLDKTQHGNWPFVVYPRSGPLRFASEPVVADLDNNGYAEVLFTSWVQKGSGQTGKLYMLDYLGNLLHAVDLPPAFGSPTWNGGLAAPTLDDIDGDGELEIVINTAHSGFVAYDLPGTADARVLWGTGRGSYHRFGGVLNGSLQTSTKSVKPILPSPGDTLTYTIVLRNPGPDLPAVRMTDTLPSGVSYLGNLWASSGSYADIGGVITWNGSVSARQPVTITFGVTIGLGIVQPTYIGNVALIDDGAGNLWQRSAAVIVNGYAIYLPLVMR